MDDGPSLTELTEAERTDALQRYGVIQPFLDGQTTLKAAALAQKVPYDTARRWVQRYRRDGLAGLAHKRRHDLDQRRVRVELQQIIEGLALQKTKPSAAAIHRQVEHIAEQQGWVAPSYSTVSNMVRTLDPALVKLAHEGTKAYQQSYDLLYRREAGRPNEIWQADHTLLDIYLLDEQSHPARPWLTVIEDDFSRCIAGYFISFQHPNTQHTSLALRQAIWRKQEAAWRICGIPEIFYTDNGSDFTSRHLEQVSADLKMRLVFSTPGMPRGRGRVDRFFQSVNQLFLHKLPGYAPEGQPITPPRLTLADLDTRFKEFLLTEYHPRVQKDLTGSPQARWEAAGFLPQMPESLAQLDLLLLTVATTRRVRRDGIHFQRLRYLDLALAAYVGEDVVIRYDPRDMAEIRVYHNGTFLCRAVCQELADRILSLPEIVRARNRRRRELRGTIQSRAELIRTYVDVHADSPVDNDREDLDDPPEPAAKRLKRYYNE
jgi:putative transposase